MELRGKAALVTGGGRGIGRAISLALAREGCSVAVNYLSRRDAAEEVVRLAREAGVEAFAIRGDVTVPDEARKVVEEAYSRLGTLHVLVNNAGGYERGDIGSMAPGTWERMIRLNLLSAFNVTNAAVPLIERSGGGVVVNVASVLGLRPRGGVSAYSAAKAGLIAATRAWAQELAARGIRVNAVAPGPIDTDLLRSIYGGPEGVAERGRRVPLGRVGMPDEVAEAVLLLVKNEFMTGSIVVVDGGVGL